jgi:glucokinase
LRGKRLTVSIGIDLGGTNIKLGLIRADGKILKRLNIPTLANQGPKAVIARIIAEINCLNRYHGVPQALGIGSAGLVNHRQGIIHFSPNLPGWKDIPLKKLIEDEVKVKVFVGNDANAFALGEYCFGAGKGCSSLFGITLGTGIGGGIIVNGKLWLGINQAAGEVGHTSINAFGLKCRCGNYGCLERFAGAEYIVERTIKQLKNQNSKRKTKNSEILRLIKHDYKNITPEIISLAAKKFGDALAKTIIAETGMYIGVGLANVVSLIDPEIIVIGGGVSGFGKLLLDSIKKTVAERIMNFSGRKLKIVLSRLKDDAALLGASQFESALGGLPQV